MRPNAIPDRWLEYNACGRVIEGTRLICFKVPLRKEVQMKEPSITQLWDIPAVLAEIPRLSAVIDLTNTARYYNPKDFMAEKVLHKKILMPGRVLPPESKVKEFFDAVDEFLGKDCDSLVGVHCTHGLNRTGYMVCRYLRDRIGVDGPEAIKRFETARGYKIEREVYINGILNNKTSTEREGKEPNPRNDRNQFENSHNKEFDEPDGDNRPYHQGTNTPRHRQFDNNRGRRNYHSHKPYARQHSSSDNRGCRSTHNRGEPSRSYQNEQYNRSRSNDDRSNHTSDVKELNQIGNIYDKISDEVPHVDNKPSEDNHRGDSNRFNNMSSRNREFSDRGGHHNNEHYASQSSFANRGQNHEPSRSFNNDGYKKQYNDNSRNRNDRDDRKSNDRYTPYGRRGSNHFRGNNSRYYNNRNDGGTSSNNYNRFRTSRYNDRMEENRSILNSLYSEDKNTKYRNSSPDRPQKFDPKHDNS